jgi:hypothetical protein
VGRAWDGPCGTKARRGACEGMIAVIVDARRGGAAHMGPAAPPRNPTLAPARRARAPGAAAPPAARLPCPPSGGAARRAVGARSPGAGARAARGAPTPPPCHRAAPPPRPPACAPARASQDARGEGRSVLSVDSRVGRPACVGRCPAGGGFGRAGRPPRPAPPPPPARGRAMPPPHHHPWPPGPPHNHPELPRPGRPGGGPSDRARFPRASTRPPPRALPHAQRRPIAIGARARRHIATRKPADIGRARAPGRCATHTPWALPPPRGPPRPRGAPDRPATPRPRRPRPAAARPARPRPA